MSKIIFLDYKIKDIKYSGFTITKVYACNGEVVYDTSSGGTTEPPQWKEKFEYNDGSEYYGGDNFVTSGNIASNQDFNWFIFYYDGVNVIYEYDTYYFGNNIKTNASAMTLNNTVDEIYTGTFSGCSALTSVDYKDNSYQLEIGDYVFSGCTNLQTANITKNATYIGKDAFNGCSALTIVEASATNIASQAFRECTSLSSVTLNNVTNIGNLAFYKCSSLTSVTIDKTTPPTLGYYVFADTNENLKIYVPYTSINTYKTASGWSEYASIIYPIPTPAIEYLTFVAEEDGTFKFSGNNIDYSVDSGSTWLTLANGTDSPTVQSGHTIMWKASGLTPTSGSGIGTFSSTGRFNVEGNIMSMQFGDNFIGKTSLANKTYAFRYLFSDCSGLTSAENMVLPATTLAGSCYASMFGGCSGLTSAPELPATSMTGSCYQRMFQNCSSLTTPPRLPATNINGNCYQNMFDGCTSLRTAPELPATTMAVRCYQYMFQNCSSLTTPPRLPSTSLGDYCYSYMFNGCTNLTTSPELPASSLTTNCYANMFNSCTSLTAAPTLPATTLASQCYNYMFRYCSNLRTAPSILPATRLSQYCYQGMFQGCYNLENAPQLPATELASYCYNNMFYGCSGLTEAPDIPATTVNQNCCQYMFYNCVNLTTTPTLSAATLASSCYSHMFENCKKVNNITCLATDISANGCTNVWLNGVASEGTFTKAASMEGWSSGTSGVPTGWTVYNYGAKSPIDFKPADPPKYVEEKDEDSCLK